LVNKWVFRVYLKFWVTMPHHPSEKMISKTILVRLKLKVKLKVKVKRYAEKY